MHICLPPAARARCILPCLVKRDNDAPNYSAAAKAKHAPSARNGYFGAAKNYIVSACWAVVGDDLRGNNAGGGSDKRCITG